MALSLVARGYQVDGTALLAGEISDLARQLPETKLFSSSAMLLTRPPFRSSLRMYRPRFGEAGLDLVISNVGILTPGPMETLAVAGPDKIR
jgi:hypothetical protein